MLTLAVGHSDDPDEEGAVEELLAMCREKIGNKKPSLGILYSAYDYEHQTLLDGILDAYPDLKLIGCTTDGELSSSLGFAEDSVVLNLFHSDQLTFSACVAKNISAKHENAIDEALESIDLNGESPARVCISLPESLTSNPAEVVKTLKEKLGDEITVAGGASADQWNFKGCKQFFGREVLSDSMPMAFIHGELNHSLGVASGWKPIGKPATVTSSEGNRIHTINHAPAIEYYWNHLGKDAKPTGDRPLAFLNDDGGIRYLRASNENYDVESGAVDYFAFVPQGFKVQLTVADNEAIIDGANQAAVQATSNFPNGKPDCAMVFSCSARRLLLGTQTNKEKDTLHSVLGGSLPIGGFYGYGEISQGDYHNETCIVLLLGEKD